MTNENEQSKANQDFGRNARLEELLCGLVEGGLTESERSELAAILNASEEAQKYYLAYLQLHTELTENGGGLESRKADRSNDSLSKPLFPRIDLGDGESPGTKSIFGLGMGFFLGVFSITVLGGAAVYFFWFGNQDLIEGERQVALGDSTEERDINANSPVEGKTFTVSKSAVDQHYAVVVHSDGNGSNQIVPGQRLGGGTIKIDEGRLQIEFMGGAVLAITGPAELELLSPKSATLIRGTAVARVPERARGFVLNSPGLAVVDLGTEFLVDVPPDGQSNVKVIDGEVELSILGDDGNTWTNRRIGAMEEVTVAGGIKTLKNVEEAKADLPRVVSLQPAQLNIGESYVKSVLASNPVAYWRFNEFVDGKIPNEMGDFLWLHPVFDQSESDKMLITEGRMQFRRSSKSRYLVTQDQIPEFSTKAFSVEMWMLPDDLQHATCLSVFPNWSGNADAALCVIEIVTDTFLIHQPGSVRTLFRDPPGRSPDSGFNLFTQGLVTPGMWQHVVMVKKQGKFQLFYNGSLAREVEIEDSSNEEPFRCMLGQLALRQAGRQFSGLVDEIAIYRHALSAEEVREHYRLATGQDD